MNWVEKRTSLFGYELGRGRRLTLDDLQMFYRKKDVPEQMERIRREKTAMKEKLESARQESCDLREYSRRRFQSVVEQETDLILRLKQPPSPGLPSPAPQPPRPVTVSGYSHQYSYASSVVPPPTPTNGPTKDGSILYKKPDLLENRPKSEPPSRFNHLRGGCSTYPTIQKLLEQYNCEYRLLSTRGSRVSREDSKQVIIPQPEFVLFVPASAAPDLYSEFLSEGEVATSTPRLEPSKKAWQAEEEARPVEEQRRSPELDGVFEVCVGDGEGRISDIKAEGDIPAEAEKPSKQLPPHPPSPPRQSVRRPGSASRQVRPPSSRKATVKISGNIDAPRGTEAFPRRSEWARKSRQRSSTASSSSSSDMSNITYTQYPHCWVDDVTVSSVHSLRDRDSSPLGEARRTDSPLQDGTSPLAAPRQTAQPHKTVRTVSPHNERSPSPRRLTSALQKTKQESAQPRKGSPKARPSCPRSLKQSSEGRASQASKKGEKPASVPELTPEEREEEEMERLRKALPKFMCPSSESKSRHKATSEWLAKTSFTTACRTVPIM